jgi:hypothetical protein
VANEPKIPRNIFILDEANRHEYYFIEPNDTCLYVWEYQSQLWKQGQRLDYSQYPVNQLIKNLQIPVSCKISQPQRYYWKGKVISHAAAALGKLLPSIFGDVQLTYVPIPPSKMETDPEYDSRIPDVLRAVRPRLSDIRELVVLSGEGFDSKQKGLKPAERAEYYTINEDVAKPEPETIVLVDDVLTTECHFKAMEPRGTPKTGHRWTPEIRPTR